MTGQLLKRNMAPFLRTVIWVSVRMMKTISFLSSVYFGMINVPKPKFVNFSKMFCSILNLELKEPFFRFEKLCIIVAGQW